MCSSPHPCRIEAQRVHTKARTPSPRLRGEGGSRPAEQVATPPHPTRTKACASTSQPKSDVSDFGHLERFPKRLNRDSHELTNMIQASHWEGGQHEWRSRIRTICAPG